MAARIVESRRTTSFRRTELAPAGLVLTRLLDEVRREVEAEAGFQYDGLVTVSYRVKVDD